MANIHEQDIQQWGSNFLTKLGQVASPTWACFITLKPKEDHFPSSKSVLLKRAVGEVVIYLLNLFMGTFNLTFHRWCSVIDFSQPVLQDLLSVFTGPDRRVKLMSFIAWSIHGLVLGKIKYSMLIANIHYWELYQRLFYVYWCCI